MGSLSSLQKSEFLKLIILIFHEKLVWVKCLQLLGFWNNQLKNLWFLQATEAPH